MAGLNVRIDTREFNRLAARFDEAGVNIKPALSRAINHTGDKARTLVMRTVAKQTGLKYAKVKETVRTFRASVSRLLYRIVSKGGYTSLKEFGARQTRKGVSAAPWNVRRVFPHTFIVPSLGGHVFERTGSARHPIRKLWGPAVPAELVKDQSRAAFETLVDAELPARVGVEVDAILGGSVPR
jgi:hypothetical protein